MRDLTYDNITERIIQAYDGTEDARLKHLLTLLIGKLHEFAKEAELSQGEWLTAVEFLRRAGDISDAQRNEFILLSDLFGLSSLVDLIAGRQAADATEPSLLGPFHVDGTPERANGADLICGNDGARIVGGGSITSTDGGAVADARLEIWQNAANGRYVNEDPEQPTDNLRCTLRAGDDGRYCFSTVKPVPYRVPGDGPGGELVRAGGRDTWRPAHIHVRITAPGHRPLVTEIFDTTDPYLESDAVFGVRESLAVPFDRTPTDAELSRHPDIERPFNMVDVDFVLAPT